MPVQPTPGFQATQNKGFRITFDSGWTVSVQWGVFNYCEHSQSGYRHGTEAKQDYWASCDAEVAVIDPNGEFIPVDNESDTVKGYCTPAEVAAIIAATAVR